MIGTTVSHYKILGKLGEGGMGVVYRAHDTDLDRDVALKFLSHHLIASESDRKRFVQEAKAAAVLSHPNICTIHGIEEACDPATGDKQIFIVMEYVDGKTLKEVQPSLTYKQCLDVSGQIAKGLASAHERGIIHRDIKPENIMVRRDGIVVIMDFGLARLRGASRLTQAGTTSGTAGYMAPEQVLGQETDHRADIFSLGVVLFELFSGQSPFNGVHASALMYEIVNVEAQPISSIKPDISPDLVSLIQECLVKDPTERIQATAEVRRKLGIIAGETRSHTEPSTHYDVTTVAQSNKSPRGFFFAGKKWLAFALVGLLALSLAVLSVIHFTEPEELNLSKYKYTPIATDAEREIEPAWSPDGKSIAYARRFDGVFQVFNRNLDSPLPSKLTSMPSDSKMPFWSPDGNLVYFISNKNLYSIGLAGGEARKVLGSVEAATISPNGKTIVYWSTDSITSGATVFVAAVNDTVRRKYHPAPFERPVGFTPNHIKFSPDGRRIGLSIWGLAGKGGEFWILPWPDGENVKPLKAFQEANFYDHQSSDPQSSEPPTFSWMSDSKHIMLSNGKFLSIGDVETGSVRQVTSAIEEKITYPNISPDGIRLAVTITRLDRNLIRLPLDGSEPRLIMASSRDEKSMSYSSAGDKAIYVTNRSGEDEIWLRANDVDVRPIITKKDFQNYSGHEIRAATISPDGNRVAFLYYSKEFGARTFVTSTEGGKPTRIFSGDYWEDNCSWSWDSKYLAVQILEKDAIKLVIAKVGAQDPPLFVSRADSIRGWVNWSPDNKWIACGVGQSIVLISPDGKLRRVIASPEAAAADKYLLVWSRDGTTIFVASSVGRGARLHAANVKSGRSRKIAEYGSDIEFSMPSTYILFGCLAPDGKSIVTTALNEQSDIWILEGLPRK